ncbi:MAG: LysE family translocator [Dehalococcoidia bacterium]
MAAITPGPSNLILTSTGATVGVRRGLSALVGQVGGMGMMMFLVSFGLGIVVLKSTLLIQGIKWCGIGFLLWLSWKLATAGRSEAMEERVHVGFWGQPPFNGSTPRRG